MNPAKLTLFTVSERDQISARILEIAKADSRIVGAAVVGSLALEEGDRYSDLDLTFAIQDDVDPSAVLASMTEPLTAEFGATHLFDLPSRDSLFRVLLLSGCLQVDISVTPATTFGATGPKFKLLYGSARENPPVSPPPVDKLFGYAVHHALRSRFCIERDRSLQAEYWISALRDYTLTLACVARELPAYFGRGYDQLPDEVTLDVGRALVRSLDRSELLRALSSSISLLLKEAPKVIAVSPSTQAQFTLLAEPW